jgi:general secretion pathway protein G
MDTQYDSIQTVEKKDKGFTLVELLIVIVILGILATVTVFAVSGITEKGQTSACSADRKTLEVAVEAYFAQNNAYPTDANALVTAGLLRTAPSTHTVSGSTITAVGDCAAPATTVAP